MSHNEPPYLTVGRFFARSTRQQILDPLPMGQEKQQQTVQVPKLMVPSVNFVAPNKQNSLAATHEGRANTAYRWSFHNARASSAASALPNGHQSSTYQSAEINSPALSSDEFMRQFFSISRQNTQPTRKHLEVRYEDYFPLNDRLGQPHERDASFAIANRIQGVYHDQQPVSLGDEQTKQSYKELFLIVKTIWDQGIIRNKSAERSTQFRVDYLHHLLPPIPKHILNAFMRLQSGIHSSRSVTSVLIGSQCYHLSGSNQQICRCYIKLHMPPTYYSTVSSAIATSHRGSFLDLIDTRPLQVLFEILHVSEATTSSRSRGVIESNAGSFKHADSKLLRINAADIASVEFAQTHESEGNRRQDSKDLNSTGGNSFLSVRLRSKVKKVPNMTGGDDVILLSTSDDDTRELYCWYLLLKFFASITLEVNDV